MLESKSRPHRVAIIGEALIELHGSLFGAMQQSYGGDSLNCAFYLSRILRSAAEVRYVSVLGTDEISNGMLERWRAAGLETDCVMRDAKRLPGLYVIQTDGDGERRFFYWRQESAARYLLQHPDFASVALKLAEVDLILLTGISLAVLPRADRLVMIDMLLQLARRGILIAFDTNFRAALWPDIADARSLLRDLLPAVRIALTSSEDEHSLWGSDDPKAAIERMRAAGVEWVVVKRGAHGVTFNRGDRVYSLPSIPSQAALDTTAAGDSFDAAYLAGMLNGLPTERCCGMGNAMASLVVRHRGAIIPWEAIPTLAALRDLAGFDAGPADRMDF